MANTTTTQTTQTQVNNANNATAEAFELATAQAPTKTGAENLKAILTTLQGSMQNAFNACGALAKVCLDAPANVPLNWLTGEVIQKLRATGFKVIRDKKAQTALILVALNPDKSPQWQEVGGIMTLTTYTKTTESKGFKGINKGDISARITAKLSLTREQLDFIQKNLDKLF